ncbi:DUF554 domain-containing protein [Clostridia bacterium]|nr:DUF554 domain-containing protein [Clostridia bacterium]
MLGTIVNVLAIIAGTLLGLFFKKGIPERSKEITFSAIGLSTILIGLKMGLKGNNELVMIISLVTGGLIGEAIGIDEHLNALGEKLYKIAGSKDSTFIQGFVTASLIYSIGAMATLGPLEAGLNGNYQILFVKSTLDGITSIILASTFGIGVICSVLPVFVYQGLITVFAGSLEGVLTEAVVTYLSSTGGILIVAIGVNMLLKRDIKVANLLPALVVSVLVTIFAASYFPNFL